MTNINITSDGPAIELKNNFFLLRHWHSFNNLAWVEACRLWDEDQSNWLTEEWKENLIESYSKFVDFRVDLIISSPFKRAQETAKIFAKATSYTWEILTSNYIQELNVGTIHGKPYDTTAQFTLENDVINKPFPEWESISDVRNRFQTLIREVNQTHKGKNIVLVTHGGPSTYLIQWIQWNYTNKFNIKNLPKNWELIDLSQIRK